MSNTYVRGDDLLMYIHNGESPGAMVVVGRATQNQIQDTLELIATNDKSSGNTQSYLAGKMGLTMSLTVNMFDGDAGQALLNTAAKITNRRTPTQMMFTDGINEITGEFFINDTDKGGSTGEIATKSYNLTCNGDWTDEPVA